MIKKVTLNKAAIMMKRVKAKTNEGMELLDSVIYPIDVISGKDTVKLQQLVLDKVDFFKKNAKEVKDSILLYAVIKQAIISANVNSGLHGILCQLDMMKNMKTYLEQMLRYTATNVVQSYAQNSRGLQHIVVTEDQIKDDFSDLVYNISEDITRQDSKNSYINIVVDMQNVQEIKDALLEITKSVNRLEDKKYEINNTHKIEIDIPESLYEFLGIEE